jgi:hypothetical protein
MYVPYYELRFFCKLKMLIDMGITPTIVDLQRWPRKRPRRRMGEEMEAKDGIGSVDHTVPEAQKKQKAVTRRITS